MGRKVSKSGQISKSQSLIKHTLERQRDAFNVITELESFAEDTTLSGEAYYNAKGYVKRVLMPINKAFCVALESEVAANRKVIDYCNMHLTGVDLIDEDIVNENIRELERQINQLRDDWWEYLPFVREVNLARAAYKCHQIGKLEEQLKKLEAYDNATHGLHGNAALQINMVTQKINSIYSQPIFANGRFDYSGIDMKWADGFVLAWSNTEGYIEYQFKNNLQVEFGFDKETVDTMWDVYGALKEKYPNASDEELAWRFTRLMGGFHYDRKTLNKIAWSDVAGIAIDQYYELGVKNVTLIYRLPMSEEQYFIDFLGIKREDYLKMRSNVWLQHQVVGSNRFPNSLDGLDEKTHDAFSKLRNDFIKEVGIECKPEEFLTMWNKQYDGSFKKGDFAHQQITISTIFAQKVRKGGFATKTLLSWDSDTLAEKAGWLGDATLDDKRLGPDDYISDLDAQNIATYMEEKNVSYVKAANQYYSDLANGKSRATIFLKSTSLSYVKEKIYKDDLVYQKVQEYTNSEGKELEMHMRDDDYCMEILKDEAPDAYNFIRNLEEENQVMEDLN